MKESSITFNIASLLAECRWQSMRMCASVCASLHSQNRVSTSPIPKMSSFSLSLPVMILINVLSCDLVQMGIWCEVVALLSGRCQAHCYFSKIDFLILCFMVDIDVGLTPSSIASPVASLAYASTS